MKIKLDLKSLKQEVVRSGYSINEMAERTGLARQTISKALNHEISVRPSTAGKIAKALGVDVKSIILE